MGAQKSPMRRKARGQGDASEAGLERVLALQSLEHEVALKIADAESVSAAMTEDRPGGHLFHVPRRI